MTNERKPLYEIGDIVQLSAGGPEMAIESSETHFTTKHFTGIYTAQWFAGKKLDRAKFPEASLILIRKKGEKA